ncbi:MAG: hypothetical protein IKT55_00410 [Clostridia bacterium]|nr:hypothetical protein [Clostridia bacterium]
MSFLKAILALFMAFFSAFNIFDGPKEVLPGADRALFEYLEYPAEAVKSLTSAGLTTASFIQRADDDGDELYVNAQGYQDINGIIKSPYFSVYVESEDIPVYATSVFVGNTQKGALHSFSEIYVDTSRDFELSFQLNTHGFIMDNVTILPQSLDFNPTYLNTVLNGKITQLGTYTFVFNKDDQEHGFTLFVRELVDEDKEIKKYQDMGYNVVPVEKGFHNSDAYFDFCGWGNTVFYLKRGSYLQAKHTYDITSDNDNYNNTSKQDTDLINAGHLPIGLNRCPYLNLTACNNVKIVGSGVIDLSHLDRAERRGIVIAYANNIEISGVKFINSPEWTFITYDSENITIKDVDIFGYRQNSDAFAICNSRNVTVDNSFCRSGDDLFDVKAAGGGEGAISKNVTFTNCTAWNGKARCFGICGEVEKDIKDITFKDSTVVFHDATWNEDRIPALAIVVEIPGGSIDNVTFENIDIYRAYSRPIGCLVYGDDVQNFSISNVKYKNIRYTAPKKIKVASNGKANSIQAEFENIYASGSRISSLSSDYFEYDSYAKITVK